LPELQLERDHRATKEKIEALDKGIKEEYYRAAYHLRKFTDKALRKRELASGPVYHFWRELSGIEGWGD
jgi:hypothetical protein